jgi:hypothetical protein
MMSGNVCVAVPDPVIVTTAVTTVVPEPVVCSVVKVKGFDVSPWDISVYEQLTVELSPEATGVVQMPLVSPSPVYVKKVLS